MFVYFFFLPPLTVRPKDSTAELKQQPVLGNIDTNGQNLPIQQVDLPKKPHVRQEPPVPVEPQAVPSAAVAEKKDIIPPVLQDGKQQVRMNHLQFIMRFSLSCTQKLF